MSHLQHPSVPKNPILQVRTREKQTHRVSIKNQRRRKIEERKMKEEEERAERAKQPNPGDLHDPCSRVTPFAPEEIVGLHKPAKETIFPLARVLDPSHSKQPNPMQEILDRLESTPTQGWRTSDAPYAVLFSSPGPAVLPKRERCMYTGIK